MGEGRRKDNVLKEKRKRRTRGSLDHSKPGRKINLPWLFVVPCFSNEDPKKEKLHKKLVVNFKKVKKKGREDWASFLTAGRLDFYQEEF